MKSKNIFYMQIHRSNLADYINCAMILPTKYINNRTENDIQSKNIDSILLSDGYFDELTDNEILIELSLTDNELKNLILLSLTVDTEDKNHLLSIPIPITRIQKIHIKNKEILDDIKSTLDVGNVGYLPTDKIKIHTKTFVKKLKSYSSSDIKKTVSKWKWSNKTKKTILYPFKTLIFDYSKKLLTYDKIMGMFSFMKNTNFYFANRKQSISNYSNNYFYFLQLLNNLIGITNIEEKKTKFLKQLLQIEVSNSPFLSLLIKRLYSKEQIDKSFLELVADNSIQKDLLYNLLDEMEIMEALESLKDRPEFFFAFLYANRFEGDMESLKTKIIDIEDIGKAEILLAMFGLYYGYSKIRAREEILLEDDIFKNLLIDKREKNIKFMLDSKLDYITIESIYQYAFNGKISDVEFNYLEYPKKYKNIKIKETKITKNFYNKVEIIKYFDVEKISISKKDWKETTKNILAKYHKTITLKTPNLLSYMSEKKIEIYENATKENKLIQLSYKKEDIEEIIQTEENEKERMKILDIFEKDGK